MKKTIFYPACILLALVTAAAQADGLNPTLNEDFSLRLGAAFLNGDVKVGSQSKGNPEHGNVDFDDLGIDGDETSLYLSGRWRFADSWRLDLEYFGLNQDGVGMTDFDLEYDDVTIPAGVAVTADFQSDIFAVMLGWSFVRDERKELGVGLGLHIADLKSSIAGSGTINGVPLPVVKDSSDITAPLPNVRLYGGYAFTPALALEAGLGYFSLNYDKYDGEMLTATAVLEWRPHKNFGIGAGYTYLDVDLEVDEKNRIETYDFRINGPILYVSAGF